MNETIKLQQNTISSLIQQITCTNNFGYSMINGTCMQAICEIQGQQNINGVCQCTNIYSIVVNGQCICPDNSSAIGGSCVCNISGQIMKNGVCGCSTVGAFVDNGICTCGIDSLNISNICMCPTGSTLINGICLCQRGLSIVNNTCQYLINTTEFICSYLQFETNITLQNVNYYIISTSNFSSGYVFSESTLIQDAFIDATDNVYSIAQPLFQGQVSFTNIQIQFGTQTITSGSILSHNAIISMQYINIITKNNCQFSVSSGILNILSKSSNNANIFNLFLNMSFILSNGNITLINSIQGILNIINYQIAGSYQSFNCISLLSLITSYSTITVNNLNFQPNIFSGGNFSSYLLSSVKQSSINFKNIAISLGNSSKYSELVSSISQNIYYFGGLITHAIGTSVTVNQIIFNSYLSWNTRFVNQSGTLIGYLQYNNTNVSINNACILQALSSTGMFTCFGIVGQTEGNLSMQQIQIQINVNTICSSFGIVGMQGLYDQTLLSTSSVAENIIAVLNNSITSSASFSQDIGTLFGANYAQIKQIRNIYINSSYLCSQHSNGGLLGAVGYYNIILQNITIQRTSISSFNVGSGGLIGYTVNCQIYIQDTTINTVSLVAQNGYGLILGYIDGNNTLNIQNSKSIGRNYINNVLYANCGSFTSTIGSATQC
ncbi:Conserved_hypothetical protein [Hexamita inflata]|uniref:Uncharacterized protein n=2 Tax=Hexamita inflata TaxID=28002 RepID=A0AA86Q652_9EUKA|nr:Conserved hypothetical protein [Hexamita inflata]